MNEEENEALVAEYEANARYLRAYFGARVSSPERAADLVQETYLRLIERANWAAIENPRAYIRTTASRILADYYRRGQARGRGRTDELHEDQHIDERDEPERWLQSQEQLQRLENALRFMSRQVRRAFILSRVHGYTYAEVGSIMSISPRTVEKHVAKGLAITYRYLVRLGDADETSR